MKTTKIALAWILAASMVASAPADMFRPSKKEQIQLGERVATDLRKKEKVLPEDHEKVRILRRVAARVLKGIPNEEKEGWKYSFDVIDSKDVNAFALPGGPVFFYTGLMNKLATEDQLAGVLAHEMTHVRNQHWASAYADNQKRRLGITALLVLLNANKSAFNVAGIADELVFELPYSRKHETEADMQGFDIMVRAGYNPKGMVEVFQILRQASEGGKPPEFLSTHPEDEARIRRLQSKIDDSKKTYPPETKLPWEPEPPKAK